MTCLDTLSQLSIITNCACVYFTSKIYTHMFVYDQYVDNSNVVYIPNNAWDLTMFLLFVICVEHIIIVLKLLIEMTIDDTPDYVVSGKRERDQIVDNFLKIREMGDKYKAPDVKKEIITAKKSLSA